MDNIDRFAIASIFVSAVALFMGGRLSVTVPKLPAPVEQTKAVVTPVVLDAETLEFLKRWQASIEQDRIPVVSVGELADAGEPQPVASAQPSAQPVVPTVQSAPKPVAPVVVYQNPVLKPAVVASAAPAPVASAKLPPAKVVLEDDPIASIHNPYK